MHRLVHALAKLMAIAGGLVLIALIAITCVSILGRALNTVAHISYLKEGMPAVSQFLIQTGVGPVQGDFELVEAGVAFAIFAFLPWCQLSRGHATVDVFTSFLPAPANRFIDVAAEVLLTAITLIITWRLIIGMQDKLAYGETTLLLQFPVWWAYAASASAALTASIVALYSTHTRFREWITGAEHAPLANGEQ